ncbi:hypothetical protein ABT215_11270 [Streptomyces sp900105755]|uniref:hypothetical protein n=1 Tax=Streptomyces sp. 900105755 TaxID=3154389 RepID=UPI00331EF237
MSVLHMVCLAVHWLAYSVLAMAVELAATVALDPRVAFLGAFAAAVVLLAGTTYQPRRRP